MKSAVDISALAEDIAMATDAKERAALIDEMQTRLEEAMEAAALAASAAHHAGPHHVSRLQLKPDFSSSLDLMSRIQHKKLAEQKYADDYEDDGGGGEDDGYYKPTLTRRRSGTIAMDLSLIHI